MKARVSTVARFRNPFHAALLAAPLLLVSFSGHAAEAPRPAGPPPQMSHERQGPPTASENCVRQQKDADQPGMRVDRRAERRGERQDEQRFAQRDARGDGAHERDGRRADGDKVMHAPRPPPERERLSAAEDGQLPPPHRRADLSAGQRFAPPLPEDVDAPPAE